jgi:glycogen(starch) synthase
MIRRILYAGGPGDLIRAYHCWKRNEQDRTEVSITFSSQVQDFCQEINARAYIVGCNARKEILRDGDFTIEHRPKPMPKARGAGYHISELLYALSLLKTALQFRADTAVIDSGTTHFFLTALFRLFGIRVIPVLHNSLWPSGSRPKRFVSRVIMRLDSWFFRWVPTASLCVSPECGRQVGELTGGRHTPLYYQLAQFHPEYFRQIPPPPPYESNPFQIMFVGRICREKGVFDILEIARQVEAKAPGRVVWAICGRGPALEALQSKRDEMGLGKIVELLGWTSLDDLAGVYARSHAAIVPTRCNYNEGFAMTAAEAILAGRPVITSRVVPALEVLRPACFEAIPEDVDSFVRGVLEMSSDRDYYERLRSACPELAEPFYDRAYGQTAALRRALASHLEPDNSLSAAESVESAR